MDEVAELNGRYGSPLDESGVSQLYSLAGGHPYLSQVALYKVSQGLSFDRLDGPAAGEDTDLGNHLRRMAKLIARDAELRSETLAVLRGDPCPSADAFHRWR